MTVEEVDEGALGRVWVKLGVMDEDGEPLVYEDVGYKRMRMKGGVYG